MQSNENPALSTLASAAGTEQKARACQELAVIGGPKAVPALAALLGDEKLSSHARSGLELIEDPSAGEALRNALPGLDGRLLAGAVTSLGVRRDAAAVPALKKLIEEPGRGVAEPALAALGQIASAEAVETIRKILANGPADLRVPAAHAVIAAAGKMVKDGKRDAASDLLGCVRVADVPAHIKVAAVQPSMSRVTR